MPSMSRMHGRIGCLPGQRVRSPRTNPNVGLTYYTRNRDEVAPNFSTVASMTTTMPRA